MSNEQSTRYRLSQGPIASELFRLAPDRDERASQLCVETLLTLLQNGFVAPADLAALKSPKRPSFAIRSLALEENFLGGRIEGRVGDDETTPEEYGRRLAEGQPIRGSANLNLAQQVLQGLIDPETQRGQRGGWLLRPFHESLLWYDARKPSPRTDEYTVRKVYMRGSGITFARFLLNPADAGDAQRGRVAVEAIRDALQGSSPIAEIANRLESPLPRNKSWSDGSAQPEPEERASWELGVDERLAPLASQVCQHAEGIMLQGNASGPERLWQLRSILALDFAVYLLRTAFDGTDTPAGQRFLMLSFGDLPRATDPVRQRSEESYRRARIRLSEATLYTLAKRMKQLKVDEGVRSFAGEFRDKALRAPADVDPESISVQLEALSRNASHEEYLRLARLATEKANYSRGSDDGFRVLLESIGMVNGTRYRYLSASPDLLSAMVGALSAHMPMSSSDFMARVRDEWGLLINQESVTGTVFASHLDGIALARNARSAERLLIDAGLAVGLSDRTTVVGERAKRI